MSAELWINDSGTARQIREIWINDAGTARRIQQIWVNDSGTARLIFIGDHITISDATAASEVTSPATATAQYELTNAGLIRATQGSDTVTNIGVWITPTTNVANYEARVTMTSGSLTSGTVGSWLNLGTTRTWTLQYAAPGPGQNLSVFTLEIRRASDSVVVDTATITIRAEGE